MKNLNNEENSDFEKSWKDAFEGAELEPSEDVWLKIDGVLANQEAKGFKKTIVYYKYAAAVSLLLLLSTALLSYYMLNSNEDSANKIAENASGNIESVERTKSENSQIIQQDEIKKEDSANGIAENNINKPESVENFANSNSSIYQNKNGQKESHHSETSVGLGSIAEYNSNRTDEIKDFKGNDNSGNKIEEKGNIQNDERLAEFNDRIEPVNGNKNEVEGRSGLENEKQNLMSNNEDASSQGISGNVVIEENDEKGLTNKFNLSPLTSKNQQLLAIERTQLQQEIYKVPVIPNKIKKKGKDDEESLRYFAGLQFSPGYFDPNIQMNSGGLGSSNDFFNSTRLANQSPSLAYQSPDVDVQQQISYTYGLNFGLKLAKRWLINMGLQYSKNNSSGTTSYVFDDNKRYLATPTTLNNFSNDAADNSESINYYVPIMDYQPFLEVYEFTSLPVKAGFIIVDKKLTWIISTGIATDFFIQSKSHDPSGYSDDVTVKSAESTYFKKVFFNGLGSSELIYNINKNYSISLEPSFRAALSSFSKSESLISSHPKSFGVAAGFRYNF